MICPHCGSHIPDGSTVCPACHAELEVTATLPRLTGSYCQSCGALVPAGATACPKCGMPQKPTREVRIRTRKRPQEVPLREEAAHERTNPLPRIESAIPSEGAFDAYHRDRMPRMRVVLVAMVAALAVVGGAALFLSHPWNPDAFATRAKEPADTSKAGYPGQVDSLKGQDSSGEQQGVKSGDQTSYERLEADYKTLGELSDKLDDSVTRLEEKGIEGDKAEREAGSQEAQNLAIQISNCISDIQSTDVSSGTYTTSVQELATMGNYLRNRSDAVSRAWTLAVQAADPASERSSILAPIKGDASSFNSLFKTAYASFKLPEPQS